MENQRQLEDRIRNIELKIENLFERLNPWWKTMNRIANEKANANGLYIINLNRRVDSLEKRIKELEKNK